MQHAPQEPDFTTDVRLPGPAGSTGLRIPEPQFASKSVLAGKTVADREPSTPAPAPVARPRVDQPAGQVERPRVEQLRWARCPESGLLHLVQPVDVTVAAARGYAPAVCGHQIVAEGLTINCVPSGALCMACVIAATS